MPGRPFRWRFAGEVAWAGDSLWLAGGPSGSACWRGCDPAWWIPREPDSDGDTTVKPFARVARTDRARPPVRSTLVTAAVLAAACSAGGDADSMDAPDVTAEPQALSLFGEPLYAQADTTGQIAAADAALAEDPDNVELLIAAGRVRRNVWQYRQAMELYGRAVELAPQDWRPYRFRGHRHISLRQFDRAISDLEAARERAPLNWDVAYHLGLAYYLAGRFEDAANEYRRCLEMAEEPSARAAQSESFRSCSQNGDDAESRVAMTEWSVRALLRAGRTAEAQVLLDGIGEDLAVEENVAYHHDLLFYKGLKTADELLNPGSDGPYRRETVGYGVANWRLTQGDTTGAVELLEELASDPWWPGFGRIAAEVDLARLTVARRPEGGAS